MEVLQLMVKAQKLHEAALLNHYIPRDTFHQKNLTEALSEIKAAIGQYEASQRGAT